MSVLVPVSDTCFGRSRYYLVDTLVFMSIEKKKIPLLRQFYLWLHTRRDAWIGVFVVSGTFWGMCIGIIFWVWQTQNAHY